MDPLILQKIDESLLHEYSCLEVSDLCYFIGEYAGKQSFDYKNHNQPIENMNDVIHNLKKPMNRPDLRPHKDNAISQIANWIVSTTSWDKLKKATWVPLPPSKLKNDPDYDDRLFRVLLKMKEIKSFLDIRELLLTKASREPAHAPGAVRSTVNDHLKNFKIDESSISPKPRAIILFDDVITSGATFKAAQIILQKEFPGVPIIGLFVARNVKITDVQS